MQSANIDMNSCRKILAAIAGTFLSLVTIDVNSALAGNFTFTSIVNDRDNKDFSSIGGGLINDNGTVAFVASTSSGEGIFTSDGAFTTALKPSFPFSYFIDGIAINNSDTVAFGNLSSEPEEGLFIINGNNVTTIATSSDGLFGSMEDKVSSRSKMGQLQRSLIILVSFRVDLIILALTIQEP